MRGWNGLLVALGLQLVLAGVLSAQTTRDERKYPGFDVLPRFGIGYVANPPEEVTGAALWGVFDVLGGLGLYVDIKGRLSTPANDSDFLDGVTPAEVDILPGQGYLHNEYSWWSVNGAVIRPLSNEMMIYLGAGYARRAAFRRYRDESGDYLPPDFPNTLYWVRDDAATVERVNVLGGLFIRFSEAVSVQMGLEKEPFGFTVGGHYSVAFP